MREEEADSNDISLSMQPSNSVEFDTEEVVNGEDANEKSKLKAEITYLKEQLKRYQKLGGEEQGNEREMGEDYSSSFGVQI